MIIETNGCMIPDPNRRSVLVSLRVFRWAPRERSAKPHQIARRKPFRVASWIRFYGKPISQKVRKTKPLVYRKSVAIFEPQTRCWVECSRETTVPRDNAHTSR